LLAANVLVSVIFAAMHGPVWPSPVPLFFFSLGLGVLYQRTGGLVAPVVLHAMLNGLTTLLLYLTVLAGGPDALKPVPPAPVEPVAPKEVGMPPGVEPGVVSIRARVKGAGRTQPAPPGVISPIEANWPQSICASGFVSRFSGYSPPDRRRPSLTEILI
jgi:hypothetical protein